MKKNSFDKIIIFADGACSGNPGQGGWGTIVVTPEGEVTELGGSVPETTNNRMEIVAAGRGIQFLKDSKDPIAVYTDSTYVIRGITQWIWGWRRGGWKNASGQDVANKDLWEWLADLCTARKDAAKIEWHYVRGHNAIPGNERVDEIAVAFSKSKKPELFKGPLTQYDVAIYDIPEDTSLPEMKEPKAKAKALSYLSVVDGIVRRHATWPECERTVKGRSGAKFKKALNENDEAAILSSWGYSLKDIREQ